MIIFLFALPVSNKAWVKTLAAPRVEHSSLFIYSMAPYLGILSKFIDLFDIF